MDIKRVACVGAGLIGSEWAALFAANGIDVVVQDTSEEILEQALERIESNIRFINEHGLAGGGGAEGTGGSLKTTTSVSEAVSQAQYVQESVPDNYDTKKEVFRKMDAACPAETILASSASGLLMTEIQKAVSIPGRCILVHPMLPVHLIPAVEIAGGLQTSPETVEETRTLLERVGKTPVVLKKEVSGYIVNRLQAALIREAIDLVAKGAASPEDVDTAFCRGIGLRSPVIGPFLRMHLAGDGIEDFLTNFAESYRYRWETMETWTSIPPAAFKAVVEGTGKMQAVRGKSVSELRKWRDEMLVKLLRTVEEGTAKPEEIGGSR